MGKITLVIEGTTVGTVANDGGVQIPYEVSEQDSGRLIAAMADFYQSRFKDENGVPFAPNIAQVVKAWFDDVVRLALNQTRDYEQRANPPALISVAGADD